MIYTAVDNFYLTDVELSNSPSRNDGIDGESETTLRVFGAELIQEAGILLGCPQAVMATGQILLQRFYCKKSLQDFNVRRMAPACLFLSAKLEEWQDRPRLLRDIIMVFDRIMKRRQGRPLTLLDHGAKEYVEFKNDIIRFEIRLLKTFGFIVHAQHPHSFVVSYVRMLTTETGNDSPLFQEAWNTCNDSLRTTLCVRFKPEIIACGAIFLAARQLAVALPEAPAWWGVFSVRTEHLVEVVRTLHDLYSRPKAEYINVSKEGAEAAGRAAAAAAATATPTHQADTSPAPAVLAAAAVSGSPAAGGTAAVTAAAAAVVSAVQDLTDAMARADGSCAGKAAAAGVRGSGLEAANGGDVSGRNEEVNGTSVASDAGGTRHRSRSRSRERHRSTGADRRNDDRGSRGDRHERDRHTSNSRHRRDDVEERDRGRDKRDRETEGRGKERDERRDRDRDRDERRDAPEERDKGRDKRDRDDRKIADRDRRDGDKRDGDRRDDDRQGRRGTGRGTDADGRDSVRVAPISDRRAREGAAGESSKSRRRDRSDDERSMEPPKKAREARRGAGDSRRDAMSPLKELSPPPVTSSDPDSKPGRRSAAVAERRKASDKDESLGRNALDHQAARSVVSVPSRSVSPTDQRRPSSRRSRPAATAAVLPSAAATNSRSQRDDAVGNGGGDRDDAARSSGGGGVGPREVEGTRKARPVKGGVSKVGRSPSPVDAMQVDDDSRHGQRGGAGVVAAAAPLLGGGARARLSAATAARLSLNGRGLANDNGARCVSPPTDAAETEPVHRGVLQALSPIGRAAASPSRSTRSSSSSDSSGGGNRRGRTPPPRSDAEAMSVSPGRQDAGARDRSQGNDESSPSRSRDSGSPSDMERERSRGLGERRAASRDGGTSSDGGGSASASPSPSPPRRQPPPKSLQHGATGNGAPRQLRDMPPLRGKC